MMMEFGELLIGIIGGSLPEDSSYITFDKTRPPFVERLKQLS